MDTVFIGVAVGGVGDGKTFASESTRLSYDGRFDNLDLSNLLHGLRPPPQPPKPRDVYRRLQIGGVGLWVLLGMTDDEALGQVLTFYTRR